MNTTRLQVTTLRLSEELRRRVAKRAAQEKRTFSQQLRLLIEIGLDAVTK